jgi:hypothetical protein
MLREEVDNLSTELEKMRNQRQNFEYSYYELERQLQEKANELD